MKCTWTRRSLALALVLLMPIGEPAMASITPSINYQGFLTDKVTGLPIEGAKDMEFAFYPAATGGSAQFTETRCASASKAVSVVKGRYQVEIGSNTAGGITQTLFTANPTVWLEVRVDPDDNCASFEALAPRVRMQAAPYAFEALHASTATHLAVVGDMPGVSVSSHLFVVNGSSVGIGTTSPAAKFHVSSGTLLVDGDAATSFQVGVSSFIINSSGTVGIGTASPDYGLEVINSAGAHLSTTSTAGYGLYLNPDGNVVFGGSLRIVRGGQISAGSSESLISVFAGGTARGGQIDFYGGGVDTNLDKGGTLVFRTGRGWDGSSVSQPERMRIDYTGNIGISTGIPQGLFDVGGGSFVVKPSGKVGIGTTDPEAALHVVGVSSITASITVGGVDYASVPRGAVMFFNLSSCPSGWAALVAAQGRYLVGLPSGGTLAGTAGTALTNLEDRPVGQHNHAITDPGHAHNFVGDASGTDTVPGGDAGAASTTGSYAGIVASNTTGITINNSGSVAGTPAPYLQLLVCQKN